MSDTDGEICGYETASGTPCKNPATEEGHCWLEAHGGDVQNGRDFAISESDHEDILDAARLGASKSGCARAAGVSHTALQRYLDAHEDFRSTFMRARSQGERELLKGALYQRKNDPEPHREMDGQHARFLLSTSFDYRKTENKNVDLSGDIDIDTEFVAIDEDTNE